MYNMAMFELDDVDRKLIAELRTNARAPVTTLARRIGVSRATVNNRLERLEENGTVLGFTVRVRENEDFDTIRAISLIEVEGRTTTAVIQQLRGLHQVRALHSTNGGWDLVAEIHVTSLPEFDQVLGHIRGIAGVVNSETSLLLSSVLR